MLIALVNDQRTVPAPKLKGLCPGCKQPVTAKCGQQRAWHWAHDTKIECDSWWEETEWHRAWKGHFPLEWQEVILYDLQTGEKHIADIRTAHRLVIEFQYSPLDPQERIMRENFYKNMIWIVDSSHRKNDYKRFQKGFGRFLKTHRPGIFLVTNPEKTFPLNWVASHKPVLFDFRGLNPVDPPDNGRELLWCLLPGRVEQYAVLVALNRTDIVGEATRNSDLMEVLQKGHIEARNFLNLSRRPMPISMLPPPRFGKRFSFRRF